MKTVFRDLARFDPEILMAVPLMVEMLHKKLWAEIEKAGRKGRVQRLMKLFLAELRLGRRTPVSLSGERQFKGRSGVFPPSSAAVHISPPDLLQNCWGLASLFWRAMALRSARPLVSRKP